jgi:hypothetical protein
MRVRLLCYVYAQFHHRVVLSTYPLCTCKARRVQISGDSEKGLLIVISKNLRRCVLVTPTNDSSDLDFLGSVMIPLPDLEKFLFSLQIQA